MEVVLGIFTPFVNHSGIIAYFTCFKDSVQSSGGCKILLASTPFGTYWEWPSTYELIMSIITLIINDNHKICQA